LELLDCRQRGRTGHRVLSERRKVIARLKRISNLLTSGEGTEWETIGNSFGLWRTVWNDIEVAGGPHFASPPVTGLCFVNNEESTPFVCNLLDPRQPVFWWDDNTAFSHYGFDNDGC
jgi:hypothetical protein